MIKSRIRAFLGLNFYALFGHHEKSYENRGAAPGHHFNRESMNFFDFVSTHYLGITKKSYENHEAPPGHDFMIRHLA
jgi:hypothetical protein